MVSLASKKKISVIAVLGVASLAVAGWFVLFGTSSLITREMVEANLQDLSTQLATEAKNHGKEARLSYDAIDMQGWGYNKRALVKHLSVEITEPSVVDTKKWSLSTESVLVALDPTNPTRLLIELAEPVNIIENSELKTIATFSAPLRYGYLDTQENGVHTIQHDAYLPSRITLSTPGASGEPVAAPADPAAVAKGTRVISYRENPTVHIALSPEQKTRSMDYEFADIAVVSEEGNLMTIASLSSHFDEAPSAEGRVAGKYNFTLNNVSLRGAEGFSKPYSVNLAFTFDGQAQDPAGLSKVFPGLYKADVALSEARFGNDDFTIRASGTLSSSQEDSLLFGELKLEVDNLPQFMASEIVPGAARAPLKAAFEKASAQKITGLTQLSIPLKREKNGVFYVGQTTFEALATSFFSDLLTQSPADSMPVEAAPSAGAPKP